MHVFQRTPPWILPHPDRPITRLERSSTAACPAAQRLVREAIYWGRERFVRRLRHEPGSCALAEASAAAPAPARSPTRSCGAKLTPDYRIGCKRILLSNEYYPALAKPNVELVTDGIREVDGTLDRHRRRRRARGRHDHPRHRLPRHRPAGRQAHPRARRRCTMSEVARRQPAGLPGHDDRRLPQPVHAHRPEHRPGPQLDGLHDRVPAGLRRRRSADHGRARAGRGRGAAATCRRAYNDELQADMRGTVWTVGGCASWYLDEHGRNATVWPGFTFAFRRARGASIPTPTCCGRHERAAGDGRRVKRRPLALVAGAAAGAPPPRGASRLRADRRRVRRDPADAALHAPLGRARAAGHRARRHPLHAEGFGPEDAPTIVLVHGWTCAQRFWTCRSRPSRPSTASSPTTSGATARAGGPPGATTRSRPTPPTSTPCCRRLPGAGARWSPATRWAAMTLVAWAGQNPERVLGAHRRRGAHQHRHGRPDLRVVRRARARAAEGVQNAAGRVVLSAKAPLPSARRRSATASCATSRSARRPRPRRWPSARRSSSTATATPRRRAAARCRELDLHHAVAASPRRPSSSPASATSSRRRPRRAPGGGAAARRRARRRAGLGPHEPGLRRRRGHRAGSPRSSATTPRDRRRAREVRPHGSDASTSPVAPCFITGAARGIGAGGRRAAARQGANVALVGLEPDLLEELAAQLGDRAAAFEADVTDAGALERAVAGDGRRFGAHRRRDRQRGHPLHRRAGHCPRRAGRARAGGQPDGRLAHRPRRPAADRRAQGLPAEHLLARGGQPRAADGPVHRVEGRRRGADRLAAHGARAQPGRAWAARTSASSTPTSRAAASRIPRRRRCRA